MSRASSLGLRLAGRRARSAARRRRLRRLRASFEEME